MPEPANMTEEELAEAERNSFVVETDEGFEASAEVEPEPESPEPEPQDAEDEADQDAEDDEDDEPPAVDPRTQEAFNKRLAKERQKRREAEEAQRAVQRRLDQLEADRHEDEAEDETDDEPLDPNDFNTFDEYQKALDARKSPRAKADAKKEKDGKEEVAPGITKADFDQKASELYTAVEIADPEFADKLRSDGKFIVLSHAMVVAAADADNPHAVLQYMVENPDEAREIAQLRPANVKRRIADIERDQLAERRRQWREGGKKGAEPTRKASSAPEPITPGSGKRTAPRTAYDAAEADDFRAFERLRNEEEAKGRDSW